MFFLTFDLLLLITLTYICNLQLVEGGHYMVE